MKKFIIFRNMKKSILLIIFVFNQRKQIKRILF